MSKMNCLRVVNLSYNNDARKIEDEIFELNGSSTLLSLENGGGKSVLVQMMMAPFVRKRYRDLGDRTFTSYFTTNRPTHILVEWVLDGGAGYVLTGLVVRKRDASVEDDNQEELEINGIIYEYREPNKYDIRNIPVVELEDGHKKLLSYQAVLKLFDKIKAEKSVHFQRYDLTHSAQQSQYFRRLKQYQIDNKEWETIIKKVNLKESGLSELFKDAKDETGLVTKWFLPSVESKLNREENKMKQFSSLLYKYFEQYKQNESKMEKKETILAFREDAKLVQEQISNYEIVEQKKLSYEKKIGNLRCQLKALQEEASVSVQKSEEQIWAYERYVKQIQYEELSYKTYQHIDEKEKQMEQERLLQQIIAQMEEEKKLLKKKRNILECARLLVDCRESQQRVRMLEHQLEVLKQDEKSLVPERNNIGYNLRLYYESLLEKEVERHQEYDLSKSQKEERKSSIRTETTRLQEQQQELYKKDGIIQGKLLGYDKEEKIFCEQYEIELARSILGIYEEGLLAELEKKYQREWDLKETLIASWKQKRVALHEKENDISREIEDMKGELGRFETSIEVEKSKLSKWDDELEQRKEALRYIGFNSQKRFDRNDILAEFQKNIERLEEGKREVERVVDELQREHHNMATGRVMKLPEEMVQLLYQLDIHYLYGMEYLKKNPASEEEKQELVRKNPFLPYSIIVTRKELAKLESADVSFYTASPIPILVREDLSKDEMVAERGVIKTGSLYFFTSFNQHLLNEESLRKLLEEKKEEIAKEKAKLDRKLEEIRVYQEKQNMIRYQEVTKDKYTACRKAIEDYLASIQSLNDKLVKLRDRKDTIKLEIQKLGKEIEAGEEEISRLKSRQTSFGLLCDHYVEYLNHRQEQETIKREIKEKNEKIAQLASELTDVDAQLHQLIKDIGTSKQTQKEYKSKVSIYENYKEGTVINSEIVDLEARYQAITEQLGTNQKIIEDQLERERNLLSKRNDNLARVQSVHNLEEDEFATITPDEDAEKELRLKEEQLGIEIKEKSESLQMIRTKNAVTENEIRNLQTQIKTLFQKDTLVPKDQIRKLNFAKRIQEANTEKDREKKLYNGYVEVRNAYSTNYSSLSEFADFDTMESCDFTMELSQYKVAELRELSIKHLDKFRGELIRDYRRSVANLDEERSALEKKIEEMLYRTIYQEEFFHTPIVTMYKLVSQIAALKEQLAMTVDSFEIQLEKLEVDLSLVADEREKIMEMLFEYVAEIHRNLDKIDKNSTIPIRDKSVKMLQLQLLNWEEHEKEFQSRLSDFMKELTDRVLEKLERNENIGETLDLALTTKNLYDSVVGIGSIGIKLFKIEADRESPITWKDVAKNSGGEGFLSAFVVLSSLLSYMRRDETDLFVEREEGKVLVMDNPFAQTQSLHLLKPLMDIAKKCNTQLICLTGIGGEAIYNRFDNIYVLNLVQSGLAKHLTYVRAEHIKGAENLYMQRIQASRFVVQDAEQVELEF